MSDNSRATIWYMDGEHALYYDERKPDFNENREDIIEILMVPTDIMKAKYSIEEERLNIDLGDGRRGMWVPYKKELLFWVTRGIAFPKLLILCGWDGLPTEFMDYIDPKNLLFLYDNEKKRNWSLKMLVKRKDDEIKNMEGDRNELTRSLVDLDKIRRGVKVEEYKEDNA